MEHKIDQLSGLPELVLERILSFIPLKKILQLTTLSKRWQNVWFLFPILEINEDVVRSEDFNSFVEKSLLSCHRQKLSLNKFELIMNINESNRALVNRWIGDAIEINVKELNLYIHLYPHKSYLQVPDSVVTAKSITELRLWGCKFEPFHRDINLPYLKSLVLVEALMDGQILQTLIAGCPVVEEIILKQCDGLKNIHVSSLPKLTAIEVILTV
jgi:hypothetical protein